MIRTGLSLNVNGIWEVAQLTHELQQIVSKFRSNFEGSKEGLNSLSEAYHDEVGETDELRAGVGTETAVVESPFVGVVEAVRSEAVSVPSLAETLPFVVALLDARVPDSQVPDLQDLTYWEHVLCFEIDSLEIELND
ncbi:hypothetical protein R1sor_010976 [Riccia sorocarpa]|uniref:Uncharacterized protein n=1 Tax=Riccia sorocarpa TaxID=122646 RepID=A0ABD3HZJ8_9MARC